MWGTGSVWSSESVVWVKERQEVNSDWLRVGEGLSLAGLLLVFVSVVGKESLLWRRGDIVPGVPGRLGAELELLALPHRLLGCFSRWPWSRWLKVRLLLLFEPEEEELEEEEEDEEEKEEEEGEDEEAVPLPEELELSPGCGAILGYDFRIGRYFLGRLCLEVASLEAGEAWRETTGWRKTTCGCWTTGWTTGWTTSTVGLNPQGFRAGGLSPGCKGNRIKMELFERPIKYHLYSDMNHIVEPHFGFLYL